MAWVHAVGLHCSSCVCTNVCDVCVARQKMEADVPAAIPRIRITVEDHTATLFTPLRKVCAPHKGVFVWTG